MLLLEYDQIVKDHILPVQPTGAELPHSLDARRPPFIHVNKSLFFPWRRPRVSMQDGMASCLPGLVAYPTDVTFVLQRSIRVLKPIREFQPTYQLTHTAVSNDGGRFAACSASGKCWI